jgi:hypothetical protein
MTLNLLSFRKSTGKTEPPRGLSLALQALWWDAKGDWGKAHHCAQERDDDAGMWVHAYLHRKEGDLSNADYWYRRARKTPAKVSLAEEWESLAKSFLAQQ